MPIVAGIALHFNAAAQVNPIDPVTPESCIAAGPGVPHPAPGSGCFWQYSAAEPWVGAPYQVSHAETIETFPSETLRYVYNDSIPLPCAFTPLAINDLFQRTVTKTHRVNVNGTFGYDIGLTAEAEASYLGILAGRIKTDIGAEVEIGAGWSGEWTEVVMQQQATIIPICHEQVREGEIRKVTAVWRTPYGQMLS